MLVGMAQTKRHLPFGLLRLGAAALLWLGLAATAHAEGRFDQGLLWRLDPPGGGRASFLLGTMHVADPRVLDVPAVVSDALLASDVAVFEVLDDPRIDQRMMAAVLYDDGRTLDEVLDPALYGDVREVAADYGLIPSVLRLYRPWGLVLLFTLPVDQVRLVMANQRVLDTMLQERAAAHGLELRQLETVEQQIAVFADMTEDDQIALLASVVGNKAANDAAFHDMLEAYVARDLGAIDRLSRAADGMMDELMLERVMHRLKVERDARMFEGLQPMVDDGGVFAAVGALHLTGDTGLLQRFADAGYAVTAID